MARNTPCGRTGCDMNAAYHPELSVWAVGNRTSRRSTEPARMVIGVPLCLSHAKEFDAQAFLTEETRERLALVFKVQGVVAPDWSSAQVKPVAILASPLPTPPQGGTANE